MLVGELSVIRSPAAPALADIIGQIDEDILSNPGISERVNWLDSIGVPDRIIPSDLYTVGGDPGWAFDTCNGPMNSAGSTVQFKRGAEIRIGTIMAVPPDQRARLADDIVKHQIGGRFVWPDGVEVGDDIL